MIAKTKLAVMVPNAILLLMLSSCGQPEHEQSSDLHIVNGERVLASDPIVKSTVALVLPSGEQFCTGTLIAPTLVVTAAHCLQDYTETSLYVALGTVAKNGYYKRELIRAAKTISVHGSYNVVAMNQDSPTTPPSDIALVRLSEALPVANAAPIEVANLTSTSLAVGERLILAGYGLTKWYNSSGGVLNKVETKIGKLSNAAKELDFAANAGKSACMGDSGGPAFVVKNQKLLLVGVTSRGSSRCNATGTYTDIRHYSDWIASVSATMP